MSDARAWIEQALRELKDAGYRAGGARQAILDLLAATGGGMTALDIAARLRGGPRGAGTASVYRTLGILAELSLVRRVEVGGSATRYELVLPDGAHAHHVVCSRCGRTDLFEDAAVEAAIEDAQRRLPHRIESHDVILHGLCPRCAPRHASGASAA